jgi:hypothetical protein
MAETAGNIPDAVVASARAIVRVGLGRGFVVRAGESRFVITAAHCLPRSSYPRPHLANGINQLTLRKIIGPLRSKQRTIWGELCALSLTDDVAVLSEPDCQDLSDQQDKFVAFTEAAITIGKPPKFVAPYLWDEEPGTEAFVLSLNGEWQACTVHNNGRFLRLKNGDVKSGMSGSPIINNDGAAIGLISTSGGGHSINPSLMDCLPPWLLRKLDVTRSSRPSSRSIRC